MEKCKVFFSQFFIVFILTVLLVTCVSTVFSETISYNLNDFLKSVSINAPQNADGSYDIKEGKQYTVSLHFEEKPNELQFPDSGDMTFTLPAGFEKIFEKNDTSEIIIRDLQTDQVYHIQGNPYSISTNPNPGTITFTWNPGNTQDEQDAFQKLIDASNVKFDLSFTGTFDKNANSISFSESVNVGIDVDTEHSFDLQKTVASFDPNTGIITYNLVVKSHGINNNVVVTDQITGTGTTFATDSSDWITCYGSNQCYVDPKPVTVSNDGKTFTYNFGDMDDGNEIHITYKAKLTGDGLNPSSDNGKIPEGITNNTYKTTSDEDPTPTPPAPVDYHNNSYVTFDKSGAYSTDNETVTWTINLNQAKLASLAGTTITDTIDSGSRDILSYSGSGIHISGTCSDNTTVSRDVSWTDMNITDLNNASGWSYTFPTGEDDDGACSYTITYTTKADTSNLIQSENVVKNNATYLDKTIAKEVNITPSNAVTFEKTATFVTDTEATWKLSIFLPANKSFNSIKLTDVFPSQNNNYFDTFKQGSLTITSESNSTITSLVNGTDYTITDPSTQFEITFMDSVLQSQSVDRTINVTFTTTFDPNWIAEAKNQAYLRTHTNNAILLINNEIKFTDDETITPLITEVEKTGSDQYNGNKIDPVDVTEDGKTFELPVYRFEIRISGVTTDTIEITDVFDTNLFEVYTGKLTYGNNTFNEISDNLKIYGGDSIYNIGNGETPVTSTSSESGATFSVTVPKNAENYYTYYKFAYYLKVKDKSALTELSRLALETDPTNRIYTLNNTATYNGVNDEASVTYTYNPLSKELTNKSALNNNERRAKYKITYNPTGQKLNEGNDITLTDTFSDNLVILYDTIEFDNPDAVVTYTVSGYTATYVIKDSSPVTITYDAIVIGNGNLTLTNTVSAEGSDFEDSRESHSANFSSGQGTIPYISILKAEKNDMAKPLSGAEFELYECDNTTVICTDPQNCTGRANCNNPTPVKYDRGPKNGQNVVVVTDENGIASLNDTDGVPLSYNKKYYLLETTFPTGYKGDSTNTSNKWFFTVLENPQEGHADVWVYPTGYTLRVWNESKTTKINLEKTFTGGISPSSLTNEQKEAITFTIERVPDVDEYDGFPKTIKYSDFTNEKYEIDGLTIGNYTITENVPGIDGYTLTKTYKIDNAAIENVTEDNPLTVTITSEDVVNHENNTSHTVSISNDYQSDQQTTEISASKEWKNAAGSIIGAPSEEAEVVFTLYANEDQTAYTVTLDGTEDTIPTTTAGYERYERPAWTANFVNLPLKNGTDTITYTIAETTGYPGFTSSSSDPVGDGEKITNTANTGTISLQVTKNIAPWPSDNRNFTFVISGVDNSASGGTNSNAKLNDITSGPSGTTDITNNIKTVTFGPLTFDATENGKDFTFKINETYPDSDTGNVYEGVTYDRTDHMVTVTPHVSDTGAITFTVAYDSTSNTFDSGTTAAAAIFTNTYTASGSLTLSGKKSIVTADDSPEARIFSFTLKDANDTERSKGTVSMTDGDSATAITFTPVALNYTLTSEGKLVYSGTTDEVKTSESGTDTSGKRYWKATYTLSEDANSYKDLIPNTTPKTITVTITDDGEGNLTCSPASTEAEFTFTNTERANKTVVISGTKSVSGINPTSGETWDFILTGESGAPMPDSCTGSSAPCTVRNSGSSFEFGPITFTPYDLDNLSGRAYVYTITEEKHNDSPSDVSTADAKKLSVKIELDSTGNVIATVYPTADATGTPVTESGGKFNIGEFENVRISNGQLLLKATKNMETGSVWPSGKQFTFTLKADNENAREKLSEQVQKTVDFSNPTADFDAISFTTADAEAGKEYKFTVTEEANTVTCSADNQNCVTYSTDTYKIRVKPVKNTADNSVSLNVWTSLNDGTETSQTNVSTLSVGPFTNTYSASGNITLVGKKIVQNADNETAETRDFSFRLRYKNAAAADPDVATGTAKTTQDGVSVPIKMNPVEYNLSTLANLVNANPAKAVYNEAEHKWTIEYVLEENSTSISEIDIDKTQQPVTVTITDNGDGTLSCVQDTASKDFTFTNHEIHENSVVISGKKILKDSQNKELTITDDDKWTFKLEATGENKDSAPMPEGCTLTADCTVQNDHGSFKFNPIHFTAESLGTDHTGSKTFTYKVTESGNRPGVTNDETAETGKEFKIKVEDKDSNITVTKYVNDVIVTDEELITYLSFTNTYNAAGTATIKATKEIKGSTWPVDSAGQPQKITFTLTPSGEAPEAEKMTYELTTEGQVEFGPIQFGLEHAGSSYTYTISEDGFNDSAWSKSENILVSVTVGADNRTGELQTSVTYKKSGDTSGEGSKEPLVITNTYSASGKGEISVEKELKGREWTDNDEFTFTLSKITSDAPMPENTTVTIKKGDKGSDGRYTKSFGEFTFTSKGTYEYIIKETAGSSDNGISYDTNEHHVIIKVADDGKGNLIAETDSTLKPIEKITNTYSASGKGEIKVQKKLEGRAWMNDDSFTFTLTNINGAPMPNGENSITITKDTQNDHTKSFGEINFTEGGTYQYKITESKGDIKGVSYDTVEKVVTIVVDDKSDGTLIAGTDSTLTPVVTITNTYTSNGEGEIKVTKNLIGRDWKEGYKFVFELTADEGTPMPSEISVEITQGTEEHTASFGRIKFTKEGVYTYTVKEKKEDIAGIVYDENPRTVIINVVDDGYGSLVAAEGSQMVNTVSFTNNYSASGEGEIKVKKTIEGRDWLDGDTFTFELKAADGTPMPPSTTVTITNGTDGYEASFGKIPFTKAGEYTYTVTETKGDNEGFDYDETEYTVKINVVDDSNGHLIAAEDSKLVQTVEVTNTYTASGELKLLGSKTIENNDEDETETHDLPFELWRKSDYEAYKAGNTSVKPLISRTVRVQDGKTTNFDYPVKFTIESNPEPETEDIQVESLTDLLASDPPKATKGTTSDGKTTWTVSYILDERTVVDRELKPPTQTFEIEVTITDQGNGTLKATKLKYRDMNQSGSEFTEYTEDAIDAGVNVGPFVNTERTNSTDIVIQGRKALTGRTMNDADWNTWNFRIEAVGDTDEEKGPMPDSAEAVKETLADGAFTFKFGAITFTPQQLGACSETADTGYTCDANIYTYRITESGTIAGVTNDGEKEIKILVSLDDNGDVQAEFVEADDNGNLTILSEDDVLEQLTFTNTYKTEDESVTFSGRKTLSGKELEDAMFTFELLDGDGAVLQTVKNDGSGQISFEPITYSESDDGKTFSYTVREIAEGADGITYDTREYHITVSVAKDDTSGKLIVTKDGDDPNALNFNNEYHITFHRITPTVPTLPETGFSALHPTILPEMPKDLKYRPLGWTLQIPSLDVTTEIVEVPSQDGSYPVTWLGASAGLLEGYALPGKGRSVITGHNHLNTMEAGPFALLQYLEEGDRIFVTDPENGLQTYVVYANEKIGETDFDALHRIMKGDERSLTMITCEDERVSGGYDNRRIIAARPL